MSAVTIMMLAIGTGVLGRFAHNQKLPSATGVLEVVFVLLVIAALDQGRTKDIAQGFAWLFLTAVLLGKYSPLTGLAFLQNQTTAPQTTAPQTKKAL